jgi:hypothetical protein
MAYLCLDDGFAEHPKIASLPPAAFQAHVTALCFCARSLSDGFVPAKVAQGLSSNRTRRCLVQAGVWERIEGTRDYMIHDYLDHNPSREQVLRKRLKSRERLKRWREKHGNSGSNAVSDAVRTPNPTPTPTPSLLEGERGLGRDASPQAAPRPQEKQLVIDAMGLRIAEQTARDLLARHGPERFGQAVSAGRRFNEFERQQDAFYAALDGEVVG